MGAYIPNALGWISGILRKRGFQGSLYLSRESLGNWIFPLFQTSTTTMGGHVDEYYKCAMTIDGIIIIAISVL
jgi:hypothetical protein